VSYQAPKDHELNPDPDSDFWRPAKALCSIEAFSMSRIFCVFIY
jgi:hypothetical protein